MKIIRLKPFEYHLCRVMSDKEVYNELKKFGTRNSIKLIKESYIETLWYSENTYKRARNKQLKIQDLREKYEYQWLWNFNWIYFCTLSNCKMLGIIISKLIKSWFIKPQYENKRSTGKTKKG